MLIVKPPDPRIYQEYILKEDLSYAHLSIFIFKIQNQSIKRDNLCYNYK